MGLPDMGELGQQRRDAAHDGAHQEAGGEDAQEIQDGLDDMHPAVGAVPRRTHLLLIIHLLLDIALGYILLVVLEGLLVHLLVHLCTLISTPVYTY